VNIDIEAGFGLARVAVHDDEHYGTYMILSPGDQFTAYVTKDGRVGYRTEKVGAVESANE